jgi:hypothetical protein
LPFPALPTFVPARSDASRDPFLNQGDMTTSDEHRDPNRLNVSAQGRPVAKIRYISHSNL